MSGVTADIATKLSTDAAEDFVTSYYKAMSSSRSTITSFYIPSTIMPDGKALPAIIFNGNTISDASAFQTLFEKDMPSTHYDIQSYNCHMINPNYTAMGSQGAPSTTGKNMTVLVMVSGTVTYGDSLEAQQRVFCENIVLVPNPTNAATKAKGGHRKGWLIQSQNFRLVV